MDIMLIGLDYLLLIIYIFFFVKKTCEVAYKLNNNKKENVLESESYRLFSFYKYISYAFLLLILIANIFISQYIRLDGWALIYNVIWIVLFIFIRLNISLLDHLLNIMYIKSQIKTIEKELLFAGIVKEQHRFYFTYRLTKDKFYI